MKTRGWVYVGLVCLAGVVASAAAILGDNALISRIKTDHGAFLALGALLTLSLLVKSRFKGQHQTDQGVVTYSPMLVFMFAGALVLPASIVPVFVLVPHLIEWLVARLQDGPHLKAWYIQPFNIATHTLCALAAVVVCGIAMHFVSPVLGNSTTSIMIETLVAVIAYALLNHVLVVCALIFARGVPLRQSGFLELHSLVPDFILLVLGYAVALLWRQEPWFIALAIAPLYLVQQSLKVPQLQKEANQDEKTGLSNARHFRAQFDAEWKRARRFGRPLTLIFGDMDLLREINNSRGHLAGDKALGVAGQVIRHNLREYDIGGRFGGEEFAIVLPETSPADGMRIAELVRKDIEHAIVQVTPNEPSFKITMSFGLASLPMDANTPEALIEAADKAMYLAKQRGRNQVAAAVSDVTTPDGVRAGNSVFANLQERA